MLKWKTSADRVEPSPTFLVVYEIVQENGRVKFESFNGLRGRMGDWLRLPDRSCLAEKTSGGLR